MLDGGTRGYVPSFERHEYAQAGHHDHPQGLIGVMYERILNFAPI
jgi:hypothetical protein